MSHGTPFPQRSTSPLRIEPQARWREACSPLAVSLLGLCLAVALWGYGSKLWLYFGPPESHGPRVPVAKLWSEHRNGFALVSNVAQKTRLKPRAYADAGSLALPTGSRELALRGMEAQGVLQRPRLLPFFHTAIPLRSPPSGLSRG